MSLYNTYRPVNFSEVIGQDNVISILKNQAKSGKFGHSYLLYGPSGSGKTSTARIIAMAMNCKNVSEGEPCGKCQSCQAIRNRCHWDVIEIDGARFRGIEDAKGLVYKAYLSPLDGGRKVYIIDEVHSFTQDAFNVLLKLMEEPPPNLALILCTTNPDSIPDTIKSRCQLYPFELLKPDVIKSKLQKICQAESCGNLQSSHFDFIATTAAGNMRSALNVLEQVMVI